MTRVLGAAWLLACLGIAGWLLESGAALRARVDTDLFALLPSDSRDPVAEAALAAMAKAGERQLVVLVGHADAARAAAAARTISAGLAGAPLHASAAADAVGAFATFYATYRAGLLSGEDRKRLAADDAAALFAKRALAAAYAPLAGSALPWSADPFGLYAGWLAEQAATTRVRPVGGQLVVESDGLSYVVLPYELDGSAFASPTQRAVTTKLAAAIGAAQRADPAVTVLRAGIVLHAAAAAEAADREMSLIGIGSTLGALLLVVVVFRGLRPAALLVLSLATGTLLAIAVSFALFARVHALTLVFGASLVGVAVDYSLLALGASIGAAEAVGERYRRLFPALALALATTLVGYLALAVTPFPGLVQMAAFSAAGILGAWLTVVLWFPRLGPRSIPESPAARRIAALLARWPRLGLRAWPAAAALAALALVGLARLSADDDVRSLVRPDPTLLAEQLAVGRILDLPSPAQFFVVEGADAQATLAAAEELGAALDGFIASGHLTGYDSVARWVPSAQRQATDRRRVRGALYGPDGALARVAAATGLDPSRLAAAEAPTLDVASWLADPVSMPFRHLWLGAQPGGGYATLVLVKGLGDAATAAALAGLAGPGVRYVDKPAGISQLLRQQRERLALLLVAGYALAALLLWLRYRTDSWRVLAPTAIATLLVLAVHGLAGIRVGLLTLIALLLLLGMGVDYGIFLKERPADGRMFVAICLSALATLLSFGLLAFSATPALHAFGLATLLGTGCVWLIAPVFRPGART